jgi:hypothetical protein
MLLRRKLRRTNLHHIDIRIGIQRNKYDNYALIIHLFFHSINNTDINNANITLIPLACSKAKMRE